MLNVKRWLECEGESLIEDGKEIAASPNDDVNMGQRESLIEDGKEIAAYYAGRERRERAEERWRRRREELLRHAKP